MHYKKKIQTHWLWLFVLILIIFHNAAIWLSHHLIVGIFELLEMILDELVMHAFHTDHHTTQIIVFYMMLIMFLYLAYRVIRYGKNKFEIIKTSYPFWIEQCKKNWYQQSLTTKLKFVCSCIGVLSVSLLVF